MAAPFISRQDLSDYIGRNVTADDGALACVDAACDMVRTFAEQTFNAEVGDTVTLDGTGTDTLLLPELPVTGAGTVTVAGTAISTDDYVVSELGILYVTSGTATWPAFNCGTAAWPRGRQNIEVTYDHGYAAADLPRDVRMVALTIASRLLIQGPARSETLGGSSVTYAGESTALMPTERLLLYKYRRAR